MIKVIASDMDGTLLNKEHTISQFNANAILAAQKEGIEFVIATGRAYNSVKPILDENGIKCSCILMNGSEFRDETGKIIETINIEKDIVKQIIQVIKSYNLIVEFYTNKGFFTNSTEEELLQSVAYRIMSFNKDISFDDALEEAKTHEHFTSMQIVDNINEFLDSDIEIRKIISFFNNVEYVNTVKDKLNTLPNIAVLSSFVDNIEVTNISAQKGLILAKVIEKQGLSRNEVAVFGDSFNDYSLFTEFKECYAMDNAIPEIKELATYIADDNGLDGVGKEIYKIIAKNNSLTN